MGEGFTEVPDAFALCSCAENGDVFALGYRWPDGIVQVRWLENRFHSSTFIDIDELLKATGGIEKHRITWFVDGRNRLPAAERIETSANEDARS